MISRPRSGCLRKAAWTLKWAEEPHPFSVSFTLVRCVSGESPEGCLKILALQGKDTQEEKISYSFPDLTPPPQYAKLFHEREREGGRSQGKKDGRMREDRENGVTLEHVLQPSGPTLRFSFSSHSHGFSSHSAAPLCESVTQKRFAVTHSNWVVFQVTTSQGIIPRRIRVLRSDLSEPLTGTDENAGIGPGFGVKP